MATRQTKGFKELTRKLNKMGAAVGGKILRKSARAAMKPAEAMAKAAAPVGSAPYESWRTDPYAGLRTYKGKIHLPGFAKRNIALVSSLRQDKSTADVLLGVKAEAFYAINFIEFGTSTIPKQPWLEPAFRRSIPLVTNALRSKLKKEIDKASRA